MAVSFSIDGRHPPTIYCNGCAMREAAVDRWVEGRASLPYRVEYRYTCWEGYSFRVVYWRTWRKWLPGLWRRLPKAWKPGDTPRCEPPL